MQFPTLVYRSPGPHFGPTVKDPETGEKKGSTYASIGVKTQAELDQRIKQGWHTTLPAAIGVKEEAAAPAEPARVVATSARKALEKQAIELGISPDGRWGDERLQKEIDVRLSAPSAPKK